MIKCSTYWWVMMKSFSIIHPNQVACYALPCLVRSTTNFAKRLLRKTFYDNVRRRNEVTDASLCSL